MEYQFEKINDILLDWFELNARILPWRSNPIPYYVWVSEIMLQQTRVEAVKGYFERFIKEIPTIKALAECEDEKLLKLWEGLGYYNRVKNMKQAACQVMEQYQGELPKEYEKLLSLKGIGSYTAGAIASIAYGKRVPAVDGNVLRVLSRLSGSYEDIAKASVKKNMEGILRKTMPYDKPGDFNQALMELGAMICIPNGAPLCDQCPLSHLCVAYKKELTKELPVKASKKQRKIEEKTVLLLEYDGKYAICKRKEKGLLNGLWEFPNIEGKKSVLKIEDYIKKQGYKYEIVVPLKEAKHIFTHKEWHMLGYYVKLKQMVEQNECIFASKEDLQSQYSIPTAFKAYKSVILEEENGV